MKSRKESTGMCLFLALLALLFNQLLFGQPVLGQPVLGQSFLGQGEREAAPATPFEVLEQDAIAFVKEHHPELVSLLQTLKPMSQKEYQTAIRDIAKTRKRLEMLLKREVESHSLELESWKLQSKIDLLLAKGVAGDKSFDKEGLRSLLKNQVENQKKRWKLEQASLLKREQQLSDLLSKTEGHEQERIEQQLTNLMKRMENKEKASKNKK